MRIYPDFFKDFHVTKHHVILNVAVNVRVIYRSPFLQNKDARYTLEMSLSGHQSRLKLCGEEKNVTVLSCEKWSGSEVAKRVTVYVWAGQIGWLHIQSALLVPASLDAR
jgi:hypothetical protein